MSQTRSSTTSLLRPPTSSESYVRCVVNSAIQAPSSPQELSHQEPQYKRSTKEHVQTHCDRLSKARPTTRISNRERRTQNKESCLCGQHEDCTPSIQRKCVQRPRRVEYKREPCALEVASSSVHFCQDNNNNNNNNIIDDGIDHQVDHPLVDQDLDGVAKETDINLKEQVRILGFNNIVLKPYQHEVVMNTSSYRKVFLKEFPQLRKRGKRLSHGRSKGAVSTANIPEKQRQKLKMQTHQISPLNSPNVRESVYKLNEVGISNDIVIDYKNFQCLKSWTKKERRIFKERFLQHPKNFSVISNYLKNKTVAECIRFYYLTKKTVQYKQILANIRRSQRIRNDSHDKPCDASQSTQPLK